MSTLNKYVEGMIEMNEMLSGQTNLHVVQAASDGPEYQLFEAAEFLLSQLNS